MGVRGVLNVAQLIWRLLRDKRVSPLAKMVFLVPLVYLILPYDLLPDIAIPGLGQLDDLLLLVLTCRLFLALCPNELVLEHKAQIAERARRLGLR